MSSFRIAFKHPLLSIECSVRNGVCNVQLSHDMSIDAFNFLAIF